MPHLPDKYRYKPCVTLRLLTAAVFLSFQQNSLTIFKKWYLRDFKILEHTLLAKCLWNYSIMSIVLFLFLWYCQMSDCFVEPTSEVKERGSGDSRGRQVPFPLGPTCSALIYYLKCHGEWMSWKGSAEEMYRAPPPPSFLFCFLSPFLMCGK